MKKLCAYLTLFVLGIICFAGSAAAQTFSTDKDYYIDVSEFGAFNQVDGGVGGICVWDGDQNIHATKVSNAILTFKVKKADQSLIYVKHVKAGTEGAVNNREIQLNPSSDASHNLYKVSSSFTDYEASRWSTYDPNVVPDNGYRYILSGDGSFGSWNDNFNGNGGMERQSDGSFVTKKTWTSAQDGAGFGIRGWDGSNKFWMWSAGSSQTLSESNPEITMVAESGSNGANPAITVKANKEYTLTFTPDATGKAGKLTLSWENVPEKPVVTATPASGTTFAYNVTLPVELSSSVEAAIYYTLDGTEPSVTSTKYTGAIQLNSSATVKAFAVAYDGTKGDVATFEYTRMTPPTVYIRAAFISTGSWGNAPDTDKTLTYDAAKGCYTYEVSADDFTKGSAFMVSLRTGGDFWKGRYENISGGKLDIPASKPASANLKQNNSAGTDLYLPAAGTICFDLEALKIWYEAAPVAPVVTATAPTTFYDNVKVEISATEGATIYYTTDGSEPTTASAVYSAPLTFTETTTLKVLAVASNGLSSKVATYTYTKSTESPVLYVFYVKVEDSYKATWGNDCYLYAYNPEGGSSWTSIAGQAIKYTELLPDGVFKFVIKGQSSAGNMLFKNTAGTGNGDWKEQTADLGGADIVNGALYTIKAPNKTKPEITPNYGVEAYFEPEVTYYVDVNGCSWFTNGNCTLALRYDDKVHYGAAAGIKVVAPGIYSFTVDKKLSSIEVGRRNSDGFYNTVTVDAPVGDDNIIYVKASNGNLVFDKWGRYTPSGDPDDPTAKALYIRGSFMGDNWTNATPIAMEYDEEEGVYSYRISDPASPAHPHDISVSTSNVDFFGNGNQFDPIKQIYKDGNGNTVTDLRPYLHYAEPAYNNAKHTEATADYYKQVSSGTVKAKYELNEDGTVKTAKVWYEPIIWPDLYIIGAIIAPENDTQGEGSGQWQTVQKMTPEGKQPGLFYYDLGQNGNDDLFNTNDYWSDKEGNINGVSINEIGHFNFSFRPSSENAEGVVSTFWQDAFVPADGGMGTLNIDGTPEPYVYRDYDTENKRGGKWTSTNFVFARQCRVWVDAVRQLVWVEVTREISPNEIIFDFWDKGGAAYPNDAYSWWTPNNDATWRVSIYLNDENVLNDKGELLSESVVKSINWMADEVEDGKGAGVRYHFVHNVGADFYTDDTYTKLKGNGHLWVSIKKVGSDYELRRPYAYQATYTQGPIGDIEFNHYGNVIYKADPLVTIEPEVSMIHADKEVISLPGSTREDQVMHYPYLNQFRTMVGINPGNVYPFHMEGVTEAGEDEGTYVPVEGSQVVFTKSNQATVTYGHVRETRFGSTGVGLITGIDHVNATDDDNLDVRVTYTSPGMIFDRRKTEKLNAYATDDNLPTLQGSDKNDISVYSFYGSRGTDKSYSVDLILDMPFNFRDHMIASRAAFVGYEIEIDGTRDFDFVDESNKHVAASGRPLVWDFEGADIAKHDADRWHYEAFTDKHLAVQIHRVASGKTLDEIKALGTVTGRITYHMYVPVATDFEFVTGAAATGSLRARAASNVLGDPANPYQGGMAAGSYQNFTKEFSVDLAKGVTTGVEGVNVEDAEAEAEYFTLQGVRVSGEALTPGIYIRRQGGATSKVYIR